MQQIESVIFSLDDFLHPLEKKQWELDSNTINKGLDALSDFSVAILKRLILGINVELTPETSPRAFSILLDVCKMLDYPTVPKLYICHHASQSLYCAGSDTAMIVLSDYILERFDDEMLYYAFGNMVSMLKAGHVRLVTVCNMMPPRPEAKIFELVLFRFLRAADLSSDRAGLLVSRSISAAIRCILWDAGIPFTDMQKLTEIETIKLAENFIRESELVSGGYLASFAGEWQRINMESMPNAVKLKELLQWYRNEYSDILNKRMKRVGAIQ